MVQPLTKDLSEGFLPSECHSLTWAQLSAPGPSSPHPALEHQLLSFLVPEGFLLSLPALAPYLGWFSPGYSALQVYGHTGGFQASPWPTLVYGEQSCPKVLLLGSGFWKSWADGCRKEAHVSIPGESSPGHFPEGKENRQGISLGLQKP